MSSMTEQQKAAARATLHVVEETRRFYKALHEAHYIQAGENSFADQGLKCVNCIFFDGKDSCRVVDGEIHPGAICKLWAIPLNKLHNRNAGLLNTGIIVKKKKKPVPITLRITDNDRLKKVRNIDEGIN